MQYIFIWNHVSNVYYRQALYCRDLKVFENSTLYLPFNDGVVYLIIDADKYLSFSNIKIHK